MELKDVKFINKEKKQTFAYICAVLRDKFTDEIREKKMETTMSVISFLELDEIDIENAWKFSEDKHIEILKTFTQDEINILTVSLILVAEADGLMSKSEKEFIRNIIAQAGVSFFKLVKMYRTYNLV